MSVLPSADEPEDKAAFDRIVETVIFLYTESRRLTKEQAREHDLTGPQLTVIKLLAGIGELSLTELSDNMQTRNSTVTGIIDRMESADLVKRVRSESDRRVVRIRLTSKGKSLARTVTIEPMALFRESLESLSMQESRTLLKLLGKLEQNVRASLAAGSRAASVDPHD
ncbi:MAG: MarR family transcriptional regulator [Deltaproteobacteria bacterium]|nr:MarR family transcriptional regulator [Deltaproteobacteria bacterium]